MSEFQTHSHRLHRLHRARRIAVAGALALVAVGGLAPSALAATTKLQYSCNFPYIRAQPVTLELDATAPTPVAVDAPIGTFSLSAVAKDGGDVGAFMDWVMASQLSATSMLEIDVTTPTGSILRLQVPLSTPTTSFLDGAQDRTWPLSGSFPPIRFRQAGMVSIAASKLTMHITFRGPDGTVIPLDDYEGTVDDGDPDTTDVACTLDPETQPTVFASTQVVTGPDLIAPTTPGIPIASSISESSARLTWAPSTDASGIASYDVFRNGLKIATVTENTFVASGLARGGINKFFVVAKDGAGVLSLPSETASVKTLPARPPVKLTVMCEVPLIGAHPVSVSIDATFPSIVHAGTLSGKFAVTSVVVLGGSIPTWFDVVGATSLEGMGLPAWRLNATGLSFRMNVPFKFVKRELPSPSVDPLTLIGLNNMPALMFRQPGPGTIVVESLSLNLRLKDPSGAAIELPPVDGVIDSDEDPNTFDMPCTFAPADQNRTLVAFQVL